ncbi:hypothetical protein BH11ACT7_BH11ACT7_30120 [soil metagenome]
MAVMRRSDAQTQTVSQPVVADQNVAQAFRFAGGIVVAGLLFLVIAALWVSTCAVPLDNDTAACGVPQRTLLGLGAPAILFGGALWAFVCTYRTWRAQRYFWAWQGAGMFLFTVMLFTLAMGYPALAGAAFAG